MRLKGYYYFLNNTDSNFLRDIMLTLLKIDEVAIGVFFILEGQIKCKDLRVFGDIREQTYGFTIILNDIKKINKLLIKGVLKKELLVIPSDINIVEWNKDDRLKKAKYFEDYKKFVNYTNIEC